VGRRNTKRGKNLEKIVDFGFTIADFKNTKMTKEELKERTKKFA
jgi:hypothetical protein